MLADFSLEIQALKKQILDIAAQQAETAMTPGHDGVYGVNYQQSMQYLQESSLISNQNHNKTTVPFNNTNSTPKYGEMTGEDLSIMRPNTTTDLNINIGTRSLNRGDRKEERSHRGKSSTQMKPYGKTQLRQYNAAQTRQTTSSQMSRLDNTSSSNSQIQQISRSKPFFNQRNIVSQENFKKVGAHRHTSYNRNNNYNIRATTAVQPLQGLAVQPGNPYASQHSPSFRVKGL